MVKWTVFADSYGCPNHSGGFTDRRCSCRVTVARQDDPVVPAQLGRHEDHVWATPSRRRANVAASLWKAGQEVSKATIDAVVARHYQ